MCMYLWIKCLLKVFRSLSVRLERMELNWKQKLVIMSLSIRLERIKLNWRQKLAWQCRRCAVSSAGFVRLYHQHSYKTIKRTTSLFQLWAPQGAAILVHSLAMKGRKRLACVMFDHFATHAILIHEVADADCWTQNGGIQNHGVFLACVIFLQLPPTINETLNWLSSLPILMQESFWWWHCSIRIPPHNLMGS